MKRLLIPICILFSLNTHAQVNAGMPDIIDVATAFFTHYAYLNVNGKDFHLEKKKDGWFIQEYDVQSGVLLQPDHKFWDRATGAYLPLPFRQREPADTANARTDLNQYVQLWLDEFQLYYFRRVLYYGYDGWDWDVIQATGTRQDMTDSLYESLGLACSHYALGYVGILADKPFINGDSDRVPIPDSQPIDRKRVEKFRRWVNRSIDAWGKLGALAPSYWTLKNEARYSASLEKIEAFSVLQFLEQDAKEYLKGVIFPDSILRRAKDVLRRLDKNSILLNDNFLDSYAIYYLQGTGMRNDIISIYRPTLVQRRDLLYLDRKYPGDLLGMDSAIYMKPYFEYALFHQDGSDTSPISLDSFLRGLPQPDSTFQFSSKNVYLRIDPQKAERLYGKSVFPGSIRVPIEKSYLFMDELIWMSIVNKNFLRRKIYFLFPYFTDLTNTGIRQREGYWELTPM